MADGNLIEIPSNITLATAGGSSILKEEGGRKFIKTPTKKVEITFNEDIPGFGDVKEDHKYDYTPLPSNYWLETLTQVMASFKYDTSDNFADFFASGPANFLQFAPEVYKIMVLKALAPPDARQLISGGFSESLDRVCAVAKGKISITSCEVSFRELKLSDCQSVEQYHNKLMVLASQLHKSDKETRDKFVSGLHPPLLGLVAAVVKAKDFSFAEAFDFAKDMEVAYNINTTGTIARVTDSISSNATNTQNCQCGCQMTKTMSVARVANGNSKCFNCNQMGHYARECPNHNNSNQNFPHQQKQQRQPNGQWQQRPFNQYQVQRDVSNQLMCEYCKNIGHDFTQCRRLNEAVCAKCGHKGHYNGECRMYPPITPDNKWYNTINHTQQVQMVSQPQQLYQQQQSMQNPTTWQAPMQVPIVQQALMQPTMAQQNQPKQQPFAAGQQQGFQSGENQ